jgi:hypothetical protein
LLLVSLAFIDYYINFYASYLENIGIVEHCESKDFWRIFYANKRPFLLSVVPYSVYIIPLMEVNFQIISYVSKF